ncbi:MAG: adenosylcobalamin-dependent ribonucleoside-diphosphate reductase, partial [Candidatus Woesearchaeota archaeon]
MGKIIQIRKKDGSIVAFEAQKLEKSLENALLSTRAKNGKTAKKLAAQVIAVLEKNFPKGVLATVKDVQDIIIEVLTKNRLPQVAKAYLEHKKTHKEAVGFRTIYGVRDDLGMSTNAIIVLAKRYLLRNEQNAIIETPSRMFHRVAKAVAQVEAVYNKSVRKAEEEFYDMMASLHFLPNSPTLMNAGTQMGQLSACFVLPVEDDLRSIFHTLENAMIIHQSGGGTGFSFGRIRPKGDRVRSTQGVASGPLSFMTVYDKATEVIKQGGKRRGANIGILPIDHPDIEEFINAKKKEGILQNFNVSVAINDKFMNAVAKDYDFELVNPRNKQVMKKIKAKELWNQLITAAWECGDPGIIFIDEINRTQPTPQVGVIESTNPCGEVPLLPYEACNLGSINMAKMVKNGKIHWEKLKQVVRAGVHFLDNVIDANKWPLQEIEQVVKANRKIGLGIMGWAECLARCGIRYDSDKALELAEKVAKFIQDEARKKSAELGQERGSFPNLPRSIHAKKHKFLRNATCTTIAPTGTISIIANTTSGIEPFFAVAFVRDVMGGTKLLEVNHYFEELAKERGFYTKELMIKIAKTGSIQKIPGIPADIKRIFVTSLDIKPEWHVKMQAAFQKYTDNAVSKTVNLPANAKPQDVEKIYLLAHKLKCKGITVYRYGSKKDQVLTIGKLPPEHVTVEEEYTGGC